MLRLITHNDFHNNQNRSKPQHGALRRREPFTLGPQTPIHKPHSIQPYNVNNIFKLLHTNLHQPSKKSSPHQVRLHEECKLCTQSCATNITTEPPLGSFSVCHVTPDDATLLFLVGSFSPRLSVCLACCVHQKCRKDCWEYLKKGENYSTKLQTEDREEKIGLTLNDSKKPVYNEKKEKSKNYSQTNLSGKKNEKLKTCENIEASEKVGAKQCCLNFGSFYENIKDVDFSLKESFHKTSAESKFQYYGRECPNIGGVGNNFENCCFCCYDEKNREEYYRRELNSKLKLSFHKRSLCRNNKITCNKKSKNNYIKDIKDNKAGALEDINMLQKVNNKKNNKNKTKLIDLKNNNNKLKVKTEAIGAFPRSSTFFACHVSLVKTLLIYQFKYRLMIESSGQILAERFSNGSEEISCYTGYASNASEKRKYIIEVRMFIKNIITKFFNTISIKNVHEIF